MSFGEAVRARRRRLGLSQEELARRAGLSVRGLREIESARIVASRPSTVRMLADALEFEDAERQLFCTAGFAAHRPEVDQPQAAARRVGVRGAALHELIHDAIRARGLVDTPEQSAEVERVHVEIEMVRAAMQDLLEVLVEVITERGARPPARGAFGLLGKLASWAWRCHIEPGRAPRGDGCLMNPGGRGCAEFLKD
jgi:transcriptional regulator with XRE-family HTH domain